MIYGQTRYSLAFGLDLVNDPETAWSLLKSAGVQLLIDDSVEIDGLRFYGVGWGTSVVIPMSDVIISHCPAMEMLDQRHPPPTKDTTQAAGAVRVDAAMGRVLKRYGLLRQPSNQIWG